MVEAGYQTIKSQVEEKVVPHIPTNISESVSKNMSATLESKIRPLRVDRNNKISLNPNNCHY